MSDSWPPQGQRTITGYLQRWTGEFPERVGLRDRKGDDYHEWTWNSAASEMAAERDPDGVPVPCHVERELRGYLECGIVACGFARARGTARPRSQLRSDPGLIAPSSGLRRNPQRGSCRPLAPRHRHRR